MPYLEQDWPEGVKTNVFGSINVAEAAIAAEAKAMVMISTDKAIQPVSMLGATKRFAEMATEALDRSQAKTRLISRCASATCWAPAAPWCRSSRRRSPMAAR